MAPCANIESKRCAFTWLIATHFHSVLIFQLFPTCASAWCRHQAADGGDGKGFFMLMKKKIEETKKAVQQLVVVEELGALLAACDGKMAALNLSTLAKQNNMVQGVKSCEHFTVNAKVRDACVSEWMAV